MQLTSTKLALSKKKIMGNKFAKIMSETSDNELFEITTTLRNEYQNEAIIAADIEINKRGLDLSTFQKVDEEIEDKKNIHISKANLGLRLLNYFIDSFVIFFFTGLLSTLTELNPFLNSCKHHHDLWICYFFCYFFYYIYMESKFGKTIGKFITNTEVITLDNLKPSTSKIVGRTFGRWIPFEKYSYLFMKSGIHDLVSRTIVVKKQILPTQSKQNNNI